jgi:hypothetical protein
MTLQVGLVGQDGIVIASDKKAVRDSRILPSVEGQRASVRSSGWKNKICLSENGQLICAYSGNDISAYIANKLVENSRESLSNDEQVRKYLSSASTKIAEGLREDQLNLLANQQVIAAVPNILPLKLWRVYFYPNVRDPHVDYDEGKIYGGDEANSAIYIIERYYKPRIMSVNNLVLLSAHFVLEGEKLSASSVGGLDILIARNGCYPRFLGEDEKTILKEKSESISQNNFMHLESQLEV